MTGTGFAPGKIILLGEHSVVFGQPALAASLAFGLRASAAARPDGGVRVVGRDKPADQRIDEAARAIAKQLGVQHAAIEITSELPIAGGLGSSAAFAVAVTRSLADLAGRTLTHEEVGSIALESELLFHGRPSGVDHTTCTYGGLIRFWKGPPVRVEAIKSPRRIPIVLGLSGQKRETRTHVLSLAARVAADPGRYDPIVKRLGALALGGATDVELGDWTSLGQKMNEAQDLLSRCELSSGALEEIVDAARDAGALGAKLTGAGGGGAAIALAPDPEPVIAAIRARGYDAQLAWIE